MTFLFYVYNDILYYFTYIMTFFTAIRAGFIGIYASKSRQRAFPLHRLPHSKVPGEYIYNTCCTYVHRHVSVSMHVRARVCVCGHFRSIDCCIVNCQVSKRTCVCFTFVHMCVCACACACVCVCVCVCVHARVSCVYAFPLHPLPQIEVSCEVHNMLIF